jgi:hypothetical protein
MGLLGSYVVLVGTVLGSVAIAVSSIGSEEESEKWIIAAVGTALVTLCAGIDTSDQLRALHLKAELDKEVQSYATQPDAKPGFVAFLDTQLLHCVKDLPIDIDHCDDLQSLLEHVDRTNGAVPYYKAEIYRDRGRLSDSDDELYNYLEAEKNHHPGAQQDDGRIEVCVENGTGYCRQRTAWACHTIANDLYRQACRANQLGERKQFFELAKRYSDRVESQYRGGFRQILGTRPFNSAGLEARLGSELKDPSRSCETIPKIVLPRLR